MNKITREHIHKMIHKMGKKDDEVNLAIAERKMREIKKELRSDAKMQIEYWLQIKSTELNLCIGSGANKQNVKNLDDLRLLYMQDPSVEIMVKIWVVCIGQFEGINKCLFKEFEKGYLAAHEWKYSDLESDRNMKSGFIEKFLYQQKRERLRLLNCGAKQTHKMTLCKSRPGEMITEKNKFKKRERGYCDLSFMIKNVVRTHHNYK